ncbi:hypothetical protein [Desulfosporosinus metallidurans]|uniref:Uncharacterized protein n=1 Tax=Desulfosporosinus metallidurans TaxID=1888891 RepID=A0A1Q8QZJ9_9FIRM|nr:hypothetical protein [Desulfosporosinus metallidurans]OLN32767.1 hypothetical protein DSOL_1213 [Desulfosporosinus metallidurans]
MPERFLNIAIVIELAVIIVLFFVCELNGNTDNTDNTDNIDNNGRSDNNNSYKNYKNYIEWNN